MKTFLGLWSLGETRMVARFTAEKLEDVQPNRIVQVAALIIEDDGNLKIRRDTMGAASAPIYPWPNLDNALREMSELHRLNSLNASNPQ